jgi:hypothetical protein
MKKSFKLIDFILPWPLLYNDVKFYLILFIKERKWISSLKKTIFQNVQNKSSDDDFQLIKKTFNNSLFYE